MPVSTRHFLLNIATGSLRRAIFRIDRPAKTAKMQDVPDSVACSKSNPLGHRAVLLLRLGKLLLDLESLVALSWVKLGQRATSLRLETLGLAAIGRGIEHGSCRRVQNSWQEHASALFD